MPSLKDLKLDDVVSVTNDNEKEKPEIMNTSVSVAPYENQQIIMNTLQLQVEAQRIVSQQEERIKLLERELQIQRKNTNYQTEKVNTYRGEFANLKAKITLKEKENDDLVQ